MHLTVFLTYGMSLDQWFGGGVLDRELALYERHVRKGAEVTFVSWGGDEDHRHVNGRSGMSVAVNPGLPLEEYAARLPELHVPLFKRTTIIKTNQITGAEVALACARAWNKPLVPRCGFMKSQFRHWQGLYQERDEARKVERQTYSFATRGIVTTEAMADYLAREFAIDRAKLAVVPNYVSGGFFETIRKQKHTNPTVVAIGRLAEQKNYPPLIRSCADLGVDLRIIGQGHLERELKALAANLGADVDFVGQLDHDDLPGEIAKADVFAQVSLYEGHPKSLLEAMACGAPVLATDVPGIREAVTHGETGMLCNPDQESIRKGLQTLLADESLRQRLGAAAREHARRHWTLDHASELEWAILQDINQETTSHGRR